MPRSPRPRCNGGAVYLDGNEMTLELFGTTIGHHVADGGRGAVFFVSNDRTGEVLITDSTLVDNPSLGFENRGFPGHLLLGRSAQPHRLGPCTDR